MIPYFMEISNICGLSRRYENLIFPQSQSQAYLILIYSEWCLMCLHVLPMWQQLVEDLTPIGINLATVHFDQEVELANKLGGRRGELPHIALVMDSRISYYNDDELSTSKVIGTSKFISVQNVKQQIFLNL